mmetsp:Transcript_6566/g.15277  ORF Transcript_6566/g.15277 Transcript_6566/m.15277 type:complete len:381 (+) Transcript_6566:76-1218(+)
MVCITAQPTAAVTSVQQLKLDAFAHTTKPLHSMLETASNASTEDIATVSSSGSDALPVSPHGQHFVNHVRSVAPNRLVAGNEIDFDTYTKLGQGSIARVYRAKFAGRSVAIKMLRTDLGSDKKKSEMAQKDINRELKIVAQMPEHPHIIGFIAAGLGCSKEQSMQPMIVYEYMGAGSVESVFQSKANGKFGGGIWVPPRELSIKWCQQLFSALEFMHTLQTPLAHRDVKPANLLMSADLQAVKLCDFSLATPMHERVQSYSNLPSIAGSMRYMAPEVAINAPFSLEKTDIFSASMTSFFLIHGRKPFTSLDANGAQEQLSKGLRPEVEDAQVAAVLSVGWAVDPSSRLSAAEMRERFDFGRSGSKPSLKKRILIKLGLRK